VRRNWKACDEGCNLRKGLLELLDMNSKSLVVSAFYKFIRIPSAEVPTVKRRLEDFAARTALRGLVVLGSEGINSTCCGPLEVIAELKKFLAEDLFPGEVITHKDSECSTMPFERFKVDVRPEIVTIKNQEISAAEGEGTHLTPTQWNEMLQNDPNVILIDTRNDYENEIGMFENAIDPKIQKFSDFKAFMERENYPKDKKVLLYCTGGIRCEKAVPEVMRLGYKSVYQLEGGILKYLEEYPEGRFKGECFVFDRRVAVDSNLQPTKVYKSCPHCGNPGKEHISCANCGSDAVICHHCHEQLERRACSKNCAYHLRRKASKKTTASS
jgi:UPF0176 protein